MKTSFTITYCIMALAAAVALAAQPEPSGKMFATPEEAVKALAAAVETKDTGAMHELFGPETDEIINPDRVQARHDFEEFATALKVTNRLVRVSDTQRILEVGTEFWPFPIPLVRQENRWFFDTVAGRDELMSRRIGRNELATLNTVRAYVDAQREYASRDRNGDEVLQYAQKFASTPGQKDGLYWPPDLDGEVSPLGPLVAEAQSEGYSKKGKDQPAPYHGYFFKILTRQGRQAPGGRYDYIINGNMIAGFALVAWPAEYGETGIMTFIVNQQGRVYQKDLGAETGKLAPALKEYNPDSTWQVSPD